MDGVHMRVIEELSRDFSFVLKPEKGLESVPERSDILLCDLQTFLKISENTKKKSISNIILIMCGHDRNFPKKEGLFEKIRFVVGNHSRVLFQSLLAKILNFLFQDSRLFDPLVGQRPEGEKFHEILKSSAEKIVLQDRIFHNLLKKESGSAPKMQRIFETHVNNLSAIADELMMNAVWDASEQRRQLSRGVKVDLEENEWVSVESWASKECLILTVTDPHGSFQPEHFSTLLETYMSHVGAWRLNFGSGGAGIGLLMCLKKLSALIIEVEKSVMTKVTAVIEIGLSVRELHLNSPSLVYLDASGS